MGGVAPAVERLRSLARPRVGAGAQLVHIRAHTPLRHIRTTLGDDALEEVAHAGVASAAPRRWLVATNRSRTAAAAPLSIAAAARAIPSRTLFARPAT